jgi:hypothetical protein
MPSQSYFPGVLKTEYTGKAAIKTAWEKIGESSVLRDE